MTVLPISKIRTDGGTQPRAVIDFAAVDDYMDAMQDGVKFPPIVVFYDGSDYWLADGFHRCKAAFGAGLEDIACDIHQGTQQDAQWYSFAANKTNGLRRTSDDKQRAIRAALLHPMGRGVSDPKIAEHVGCSSEWVRQIREKLVSSKKLVDSPIRTVTRNGKTYKQNTANIGQKKSAPSGPVPPKEPPKPVVVRAENATQETLAIPLPAPYLRAQPAASIASAVDRVVRLVERLLDNGYGANTEIGDAMLFHIIARLQAKREA